MLAPTACATRHIMDMHSASATEGSTRYVLQVLFNTSSFPSTGQVILHGGSRQDPHAAKKLFEDFFRAMEDMNAKDDEV